jgi:hypothetical protein
VGGDVRTSMAFTAHQHIRQVSHPLTAPALKFHDQAVHCIHSEVECIIYTR